MKITSLILSIITLLTLVSCKKEDNPSSISSSISSSNNNESTIIFDSDNFTKPNTNITSLRVLNVPTSPIEIGKFKEANILLEVNYVNEESETYLLDEDFFKGDSIELISTIGKKHVTILFKRNRVSFDFEMIEPKSPVYYKVTFKDYYGNIAFEDIVPYLSDAKYDGYSLDDQIEGNYVYQFTNKWSKDITKVHRDLIVDPIYEKKPILYRHEYLSFYPTMPYASKYTLSSTGETTHYVFYLGRVYNFPLAYSNTYEHFDNVGKETSFTFTDLGKSLSKFFIPRFQDAINRGYYYKKETLMNGELNGEENFYFSEDNFNDAQLDDETNNTPKFLKELNAPNFDGYEYPLDHSKSTFTPLTTTLASLRKEYLDQEPLKEYIYPNDEFGYYRMVLTCQTDCYIDITAKENNTSSFTVSQVKFGLFPRADTTELIKEHSLDINFNDEYTYPINLSTSVIYESLKDASRKS